MASSSILPNLGKIVAVCGLGYLGYQYYLSQKEGDDDDQGNGGGDSSSGGNDGGSGNDQGPLIPPITDEDLADEAARVKRIETLAAAIADLRSQFVNVDDLEMDDPARTAALGSNALLLGEINKLTSELLELANV